MTGLHGYLLRRIRLLVACLMLALALPPPCISLARDTSALSTDAARARAVANGQRTAAESAKSAAAQEHRAFVPGEPRKPGLATTSQSVDRRYLYLELVTLLS